MGKNRGEPQDRVLRVGPDMEFHYLEWAGEGIPIVFLHGLGGNAAWWAPLADRLGGRRIIAPDLAGHGRSSEVRDWDLEKVAETVHKAFSPIAGGPAIWGGHSWGGKMACLIAANHSDDVEALVLTDPAPAHGIPLPPESFIQARHGAELGEWSTLQEAKASAGTLVQYREWPEYVTQAFERGIQQDDDGKCRSALSRDIALAIAEATIATDHSATVGKVSVPTLLIVASESIPWQERTNIAALPGATRVTLEGGHWIHMEKATECAEQISEWLQGVEASGATTAA